jgi:hypothetical protein
MVMADLLDIAPATFEVVTIDGKDIPVRAIPLPGIVAIIRRFPELVSLLRGSYGDDVIPRLLLGCSEAVGPIIAAGCGHLADEAYEQFGASLMAHQQVKFLNAIKRATFPNGLGSFVSDVMELLGASRDEGAMMTPIKMRSHISLSESLPSLDEDFHQTMQ